MHAVLFDLDDTLYDRFPAIRTYARSYFYPAFAAQLGKVEETSLAEMLIAADGGPLRSGKEAMKALQQILPWRPSAVPSWRKLLAHWQTYFPYCTHGTQDMDVGLKTLKDCGWKIAIVTNGPAQGQQQKIDSLGIRPYLNAVIISGEYGVKKPDPAIFLEALRKLDVPPQQAWFVGDNPVMDIYGAVAVGMQAIWLRRYNRPWYGPLPDPPAEKTSLGAVVECLLAHEER